MEFIKKLINKVISFFKNDHKLLAEGIIEEKQEIDESFKEISQPETLDLEFLNRKKSFFDTYQKFKEGKINPEYILITDLIEFEVMMLQEELLLKEKIDAESKKIEEQKNTLVELNNKIASLNNIYNDQTNV